MSDDHGSVVLSGIIPDRKDLFLFASQHLEAEHFTSKIHQNLFKFLERYYDIASGVLPKKTLSDLLKRSLPDEADASKILLYEETYDVLAGQDVTDADFRYSIDALKDLKAKDMTGEAIALGFEILTNGAEVGKDTYRGHQEARQYVYEQFATIDRLDNIEAAPEGDMRLEGKSILDAYQIAKSGKGEKGILTGIDSMDKATNGLHRGELTLMCAYTNQGKTMLACQCAWHAAVKQGQNVFFATSETVRGTVMRRIMARHSREPQFEYPNGLNSVDIRDGSLSVKEEAVLAAVVNDLETNPTYGRLYIAQIPRSASLGYLEARMNRVAAQWDVGLCVIDYLALLKAERARGSEREEFNDVIRGAKVFATSFQEGRGVPIVSPWQIKQAAFLEALRTGSYGLASLSDTSEAEKSPDQIMALLRQPEVKNEIQLQFLKLRDGEIPPAATLQSDFRNAYFADKSGGSSTGLSLSSYLD